MIDIVIICTMILTIVNTIAIAVTIWVGFKSGQVDEAKRQYWQQRLTNLKSGSEKAMGIEDVK